MLVRGPVNSSAERLAQSLRPAVSASDQWIPTLIVETLAWSTVAEQHFERAARLFGAAEKMRRGIGCAIAGVAMLHEPQQKFMAVARHHLGDEASLAEYLAGWGLESQAAIEFALLSDRSQVRPAVAATGRPVAC